MNFIFGTKGFAKEVDWLLEDLFLSQGVDYRANFFVAEDGNELIGTKINGKEVISESHFFEKYSGFEPNCFVSVGSPEIKGKIVKKIKSLLPESKFPNIIHPAVSYDKREGKVILGEGNILCSKTVLTTDIKIGNFVHINLDCTVGHDTIIGDYTTISPGVHISGNVNIADGVFIGTGAVILERISICSGVKIGAGATVISNITEPGTYVGIPSRKVK
jgi:sugar O-acyltransferase (sialic acid O-acetyltransferase NeuD family)